MEARIAEALRFELERQGEDPESQLIVNDVAGSLNVSGPVDLEALAMAVAGSVAGGP